MCYKDKLNLRLNVYARTVAVRKVEAGAASPASNLSTSWRHRSLPVV